MLHSTYHNKKTNEDPKTSSVFETLLMLPDELFWNILRESCFDKTNLPETAGVIKEYKFWPHWSPIGTANANYIEPDVFIRFENFDLIIEAKYKEQEGQNPWQWKDQITAYHNEFSKEKSLCYIALGGNADKSSDKEDEVIINKCSWLSILMTVIKFRQLYINQHSDISHSNLIRIFNLIELAFKINKVYPVQWLDEIRKNYQPLDSNSISTIKTFFKWTTT